ncbi:MAG: bifunctional riboflavin kinase/FAD synthetase [Abditibacteriales bacterium]|nr:bifunctional riboflavin kinase/FAD synthetase [Abditibacteriales bacterium]MDW8366764.1 bifunctional riboflavin kinase/FAD synthetase [Abditibacteriales bacterium]
MQLLKTLNPIPVYNQGVAVAIGFFDGVHRGHQALLRALVEAARQRGLVSVVITFEDHPARLFNPDAAPSWLTTQEEKLRHLEEIGIDAVHVIPFTWEVANLSAETFCARVLCEQFHARVLVCGPDFALGRGRQGDVPFLQAKGQVLGFEVVIAEPTVQDGDIVSSTRIRHLVQEGKVEEARQLMGRPFLLDGVVVRGQGLGRQIGFPTVNLAPNEKKVLPARGVYAVQAECEGKTYPAVCNIGVRPTVGGTSLSVEFHVLDAPDFQAPAKASLALIARLRSEQKFPSVEALAEQIRKDVEKARQMMLLTEGTDDVDTPAK